MENTFSALVSSVCLDLIWVQSKLLFLISIVNLLVTTTPLMKLDYLNIDWDSILKYT